MSHSPPVPTGNQSPFPLQEAPHAPAELIARMKPKKRKPLDRPSTGAIAAMAVGAGILAGGIGFLFASGIGAKPTGKKRKSRKRA